ncbi:MAG TPA: hypothetical protein VK821_18805 [Dehalococcoidia bacterium]|nr:hypothetical protein [Dehalococcoidia bacterium]
MNELTRKLSRQWPALSTLALVFVCTVALSARRVDAQALSSAAAPSAEDAIQLALERIDVLYAGPCSTTRSPEDLGKTCSQLVAQQGNQRAYMVGRTFAEFDEWIFVQQSPAGWNPLITVPLQDSASGPTVPWPPR